MPKTYQSPDSEQDLEEESKSHKKVGVYDQPERTASRGLMAALAVILALLLVFFLYRLARGAELQAAMQPISSSLVANHVVSTLPLHYGDTLEVAGAVTGPITGNLTIVVTTIQPTAERGLA
jgi:hypothetical protein